MAGEQFCNFNFAYCCFHCVASQTKMAIPKNKLLKALDPLLSKEELMQSVIYIVKEDIFKGKELNINRKKRQSPFDGELIFVDLKPGFNWGHPSLYVYFDSIGNIIEIFKGHFPPKHKISIVAKPDNIEDWKLLTKDSYGE